MGGKGPSMSRFVPTGALRAHLVRSLTYLTVFFADGYLIDVLEIFLAKPFNVRTIIPATAVRPTPRYGHRYATPLHLLRHADVCTHSYADPADHPDGSLVFHRNVLYLLGGYTSDSAPSDELWSFDLTDRVWKRVAIKSGRPISYAPLKRSS